MFLGLATTFVGFAGPASASADRLPTLTASAVLPRATAPQTVSLSLAGYSASTYQVIDRSSPASVLLGYPATVSRRVHGKIKQTKAKPCAQIRLALSLQPASATPADYVAQAIPNPVRQGQEIDPATGPVPVQAWNLFSTIENNWTFRVRAVGARSYAANGLTGLMRLDVEARTVGKRLPCVSSSRFSLGPNILGVLGMAS